MESVRSRDRQAAVGPPLPLDRWSSVRRASGARNYKPGPQSGTDEVRFASDSGAIADLTGGPRRATSGLMRRSKELVRFENRLL
jgi:hypothetical protein